MKRQFSILTLLVVSLSLDAQVLSPDRLLRPEDDGIIKKSDIHANHVRKVEYPHLRQDDILWSKRTWERIFTLEKINHPLYYPIAPLPDRMSLFDVIKFGIETGSEDENLYFFDDDLFEIPLTYSEAKQKLIFIKPSQDPDYPDDTLTIKSNSVIAWDIKSDWYFDKQRGELKNRIIGIAPIVIDPIDGTPISLFWVWFDGARSLLSKHAVYNPNNNSRRLTFDQVFQMRYFNSVVTKEDNVYDRQIKEYKQMSKMEQLLESKRIREDLRNREHDYWQF
jgi:gliding motility associated protien GldN